MTCFLCGQYRKNSHRCPKRISPPIPAYPLPEKGYDPKVLANTLRGLKGDYSLGYNVLNEADRLERAMRSVSGTLQRLKRYRLRKELEFKFGLIDWNK